VTEIIAVLMGELLGITLSELLESDMSETEMSVELVGEVPGVTLSESLKDDAWVTEVTGVLVKGNGKAVMTLGSMKLEVAVEEMLRVSVADVGPSVSSKEDVGFVSITKPTDIPL
jgi:hypothetical protein